MFSRLEEEPFLEKADQGIHKPEESYSRITQLWERRSSGVKVFVYASTLLIYTCVIVGIVSAWPRSQTHINNALSNPRINYKPTMSIQAGQSPYAGGPGDKIENAWHDLMSSISLRVSQSELNHNGNHKESVALPEGGGNLVWMGVFHQLHCLKMIRQMNYRSSYYPNSTQEEQIDMEVHINHCIEMLRQAVMCTPDTSFTTFLWTHSDPKPVLDVRRFERKCVDWDQFMEPIKPRVVSYREVDELKNPYLNRTAL